LGEPQKEIAKIRIAWMLLLLGISVLSLVGCLPDEEEKVGGKTTPAELVEIVWVDEGTPAGASLHAQGDDSWRTVYADPQPFSRTEAHQSNAVAGMHQHYFEGATATLTVNRGDWLFCYVYLDPADMPEEVMLQWNDGTWDHRAYWGANKIEWGTDGTESRRYVGPLPLAGVWVRLEVPASQVGLENREVNGMAFTLYGGRATWDRAGKGLSSRSSGG